MASDDPIDGLFVVAPDEFVAARNALVKQLRAAKDRERAAEVAGLRRPSVPDWALNVVAADHPGELEPFLGAAEASRQAQRAAASGAEGVDLRGALRELRAAVESLVRAATHAATGAGKPTGALAAPLTARLQEVAASAGLADQLHRGRLGTGDPEPDNLFDGDAPPARPRSHGSRHAATKPKTAASDRKPAEPDRKRLRQLDNDVGAARRAHEKAGASLEASGTRLDAAEDAVAKASAALAKAQDARSAAGDAHAQAQSALDDATSRVADAEAALRSARADGVGGS